MLPFSKATSNTQPRPSLRFRTFNGWTTTVQRMRSHAVPPTNPPQAMFWLRRGVNVQSVEGTNSKKSISPPFRRNYSPFPLMGPLSPRTTNAVKASVPVCDVGATDQQGLGTLCSTSVVLIASTDASRHCRIRRVNTRKELPWIPVSKPLPPLPASRSPAPPLAIPDSKIQPVCKDSCLSTTSSSPARPYPTTPRNSLEDIFDDGLDDLSLFLRRIAYDVISASTIHRHLGFMEDGGRVLPLGSSVHRSVSPNKRFSSLIGVSLAIMEGRLPKALMVM